MRRLLLLLSLGLIVILISALEAWTTEPAITMIGLDSKGHSKAVSLPRSQYQRMLSTAAQTANASLMEAVTTSEPSRKWRLTMIVIGLGVELEVGLGPLGSLRGSSEFNLIYSNKKGPAIP